MRSDARRTALALAIVFVPLVLLLILAACAAPADSPPAFEPVTVEPVTIGPSTGLADLIERVDAAPPALLAADALGQLAVKGRSAKTGYSREQFGGGFSDWDEDGCDSRSDVLRRDAIPGTAVRDRGMCTVGATILDPYTGTEIVEEPGRESEVDIEHIVALGDAWVTGAQQWTPERRKQFANDGLVLMAVDDEQNRRHSDGDAATWLPPRREYRCAFVANQIAIKAEYGLWVKPAERDAMARVLDTCPGQPLPMREDGPLR